MKRKLTALFTLAVFVCGIFGQTVLAFAAANDGKDYTAYQAPEITAGALEKVPSLAELRVKNGTDAGVVAYSLNETRTNPSAKGNMPYKRLINTTNQDWAALVDKAQDPAKIKQAVINVIWNGYPYYGGAWKGSTSDLAGLVTNKVTLAQLLPAYDRAITQEAIWYYTDSRAVSGSLVEPVKALLMAAQKNPAPANFTLDLYDASAVNAGNPKMANLVTCSESSAQKTVSVKATLRWMTKDGTTLSGVTTPAVQLALYTADGTAPIATFPMNDASGVVAFVLFDDEQTYRLEPVMSGETEGFSLGEGKTIDLKGDQGSIVHVDLVGTYEPPVAEVDPTPASVELGAEVTMNNAAPTNGSVTLVLKDDAGNILQTKKNTAGVVNFDDLSFNKEGTYYYSISQQAGSDAKTAYDAGTYKVKVDVLRGQTAYTATVTYEKDGIVYSGVPTFANKSVSTTPPTVTTPTVTKPTTTTTTQTKTTSLTVNKIWNNDKSSSRPSSVRMQLYRDGKSYGSSVTLNASNGWKYTWSNLDSSHKWTVDETSVPSGYTKSVKNSGNTWTITNTAKTSSTKAATTSTKSTSSTTNDRSTPETGDDSHLVLWGTVGIISLSGMVLIAALWFLSDRRRLRSKK